jgi:hypothetical protein
VKAARAKVVKGRIVTRAKFPEGADLTVVLRDSTPTVELTTEEEDAMLRGISSIEAGHGIPVATVRALLRRL